MSFIFGGNTGQSYDDLIRKRAQLQAMQQENTGAANPYQQISQGIKRLGTSIVQRLNNDEIAAQEAAQNQRI